MPLDFRGRARRSILLFCVGLFRAFRWIPCRSCCWLDEDGFLLHWSPNVLFVSLRSCLSCFLFHVCLCTSRRVWMCWMTKVWWSTLDVHVLVDGTPKGHVSWYKWCGFDDGTHRPFNTIEKKTKNKKNQTTWSDAMGITVQHVQDQHPCNRRRTRNLRFFNTNQWMHNKTKAKNTTCKAMTIAHLHKRTRWNKWGAVN